MSVNLRHVLNIKHFTSDNTSPNTNPKTNPACTSLPGFILQTRIVRRLRRQLYRYFGSSCDLYGIYIGICQAEAFRSFSKGPSIKYVTLFLANFNPPPSVTLCHTSWDPPKVRHTSRIPQIF